MSTNICDFYLLLLWIPMPTSPQGSQCPGDFHPEQLTPGLCHVTLSLLPSSPRSRDLWSLPTRGVPSPCPQTPEFRLPHPTAPEAEGDPLLPAPRPTSLFPSRKATVEASIFFRELSIPPQGGAPQGLGRAVTVPLTQPLLVACDILTVLATWPCHAQATSHSLSSTWGKAKVRPVHPTSRQGWSHDILWVNLCWSRQTSPESRYFSETILCKLTSKGEKPTTFCKGRSGWWDSDLHY